MDTRDLVFSYRSDPDNKALNGINLSVKKGCFIMIMGPSGAGKSTLANCLNGLIPHFMRGKYQGEVRINGKLVKEFAVAKMAKEIGLVFQDFECQLFSTNTKLELAFGPENFGIERGGIEAIIGKVLKTIQLEGFENRQPSTLSGGQKQRLAIGAVLAAQPNIICMDEPTTDLDPLGKQGVFNIAKELRQSADLTLVVIEHETQEALNADRLILMQNGKIVGDGDPRELLRDIETIDEIGVMSLQIAKFFFSLRRLDKDKLPLTPEEGIRLFDELALVIDEDKYQGLVDSDRRREEKYGD
ncbi:MAG: ABC transporter ATP-binding protein, partial [Deltaproteobacteria bacterium]|nr:ABC transporter ATP-binding protein [Deltaproteobacteria bacterium]